jgi:DNA-binding transcriptional ArsR family regulator
MADSTDRPDALAEMRAWAHPLRLQMLSLLTGEALSAADVARRLDLTHANASYHLRHLQRAGLLTVVDEQRIRGGVAKRYRYTPDLEPTTTAGPTPLGTFAGLADELVRRARHARPGRQVLTDAELWVDEPAWNEARNAVYAAMDALHRAAVPTGTPGALRTSSTVAMFLMEQP